MARVNFSAKKLPNALGELVDFAIAVLTANKAGFGNFGKSSSAMRTKVFQFSSFSIPFMVSEMRFFARSTDSTLTSTRWPTFSTSDGCLMKLSEI